MVAVADMVVADTVAADMAVADFMVAADSMVVDFVAPDWAAVVRSHGTMAAVDRLRRAVLQTDHPDAMRG